MVKTVDSFSSAETMPTDLSQATLRWILSVADTKHRIGMQFSHWVTGTPALEAAVGSAAITQDELGHARSLYGLLRKYPGAPEGVGAENDLEARDVYYTPMDLMPRWESWLQVIAINIVLDTALSSAIAATKNSAFAPLAGRTRKMLQEERFHRMFGEQWLKRLLTQDANREAMIEALTWAWAVTIVWLGPDDDPITAQLAAAGVLNRNSAEIRAHWLATVTPIFEANGLTVPTMTPNWVRWNSEFRHIVPL